MFTKFYYLMFGLPDQDFWILAHITRAIAENIFTRALTNLKKYILI